MRIVLSVDVPTSADALEVERKLRRAAYLQQGIVITTSERYQVDVVLESVDVESGVAL